MIKIDFFLIKSKIRIKILKLATKNNFFLYFINMVYKKNFSMKKIFWLDDAIKKRVIEYIKISDDSKCLVCSTVINDKISIAISDIPPVYILKLSNVVINSKSTSFYFQGENEVFIERMVNITDVRGNYANVFLFYHDSKKALINNKELVNINDKVILLIGNGSYNYYHYLIEIIPKLYYISLFYEQFVDYKIVVPSNIYNFESIKSILSFFLKDNDFIIKSIDDDKNYNISDAVMVTAINNTLFNSNDKTSLLRDTWFRDESIFWLETLVKNNIKKSELVSCNRFFLARKGNVRNINNQSEIIDFLINIGVEVIYIEDYSFEEQVNIFRNADVIIGGSGAAWSNIVFCEKKPICITWLHQDYSEFSVFSTLAKIKGFSLFSISVVNSSSCNPHANYSIDMKVFKKEIVKILRCY
ncbi:glycosyltransferase family 61 protein [Photobacterium piscicola]|uniref:Glycosyltransferase family 61 protein n=1 Tax=Photobacterium piscicola TaxID=1378299 RepID=A0ABU6LIS9_9GAMM|nr:glycosyltransferase family 61 protein [Photobacterium piscicola]